MCECRLCFGVQLSPSVSRLRGSARSHIGDWTASLNVIFVRQAAFSLVRITGNCSSDNCPKFVKLPYYVQTPDLSLIQVTIHIKSVLL